MRLALGDLPIPVWCAPFFPGVIATAQQQNTLADVIWFDGGGHDAAVLTALFLAWRRVLESLRADLLIADGAPVALAAAHEQLPSLVYDNGFHSTDTAAWSVFRDWEPIQARAGAERAERLLVHLNVARAASALAPVDSLAQGFAASSYLLRIPAALDYAGQRASVQYVGQPVIPGARPDWPPLRATHRLFVYLRKAWPLTDRMLAALARLQAADVLCFHDGLSPAQLRQAAHIRYTQSMLDLSQVLPEVDGVICHGGGLQILALQHGKPTLALPLHTEQYLWARQAERAGCGLVYLARDERPDFLPLIRTLLTRASLTEQAQLLAQAHSAQMPDAQRTTLAQIDHLLDATSNCP